jgi:hypothetical protein
MSRRDVLRTFGRVGVVACGGLVPWVAGGCGGSSGPVEGERANKDNPRYKELHPEEFPVKKKGTRSRKGG